MHEYSYHPCVTIYPAVAGADRDDMRERIKESGVLVPVKLWVDSDGKEWLVDGRTRLELWRELVAAGELDADKSPLPVETIVGGEADMIEKVDDFNSGRRHMTASQRAAVAYKMLKAMRAATKKGKKKPTGELKAKIAQRAGIGRSYAYEIESIGDRAPDLLEQVAAGELTVPEALAKLSERVESAPKKTRKTKRTTHTESETTVEEGGDGGGSEDPGSDPDEPEAIVLDGFKNQITDPILKGIFASRDLYAAAEKQVRALRAAVAEIAASQGAATINLQEIEASLKSLARILRQNKPHAVCIRCDGTGRYKGEACNVCDGSRVLDVIQYKIATSGRMEGTEAESESEAG